MPISIDNATLRSNANTLAAIGPFDGLVGCVIDNGQLFITSGNQYSIPMPPLGDNRPLKLRSDSLYGDDDPIQWPQPFNPTFPHYSCIPRREGHDTERIMWWTPTRDGFTSVESPSGPIGGLGKLADSQLIKMERHVNELVLRAETYVRDTPPANVPRVLPPLVLMLKHCFSRLKSVAMTFRQVEFQVRDVQRSWLEAVAMLDYMEIYRPRMDGTEGNLIAKPPATANVMGTFTSDMRVAQDHFQAGLPYWLIRPAHAFANQNILKIKHAEPPDNIVLTEHRVHRQVLAEGRAGTDIKYNAIFKQARNYMRYPDPFDRGTTKNTSTDPTPSTSALPAITPSVVSNIGPVRQTPKKKKGPERGPNVNNRGFSSTKTTPNVNSGRGKFELVESPLMPLPITSWQDALRAVNTDISNLDPSNRINPHDGKYLFPEPGLFVGVTSEARQERYFETWRRTRLVCIFRVSQASHAVVPLASQEWRDFLFGTMNGAYKGQKNEEKQKKFRDLFAQCLDDLNTDLDTILPPTQESPPPIVPHEAQKFLWELAELNFRFEFLALDKRASGAVGDEAIQERQDMVTRCFPGTAALIVTEPAHATQGLASPDWRERLPCLIQMRALMRDWKGHKPTPILLPDLANVSMYEEDEVRVLEGAVVTFYTQSFFNFFGRAAVIPMRLPHNLPSP